MPVTYSPAVWSMVRVGVPYTLITGSARVSVGWVPGAVSVCTHMNVVPRDVWCNCEMRDALSPPRGFTGFRSAV